MKLASPSKPGSPFTSFRSILGAAIGLTLVIASIGTASAASWKITKGNNDDLPGQNVTVTQDGKVVARLIYGEGQVLPYLAIYDTAGRRLTNAGIDKEGKTVGIESHHRGIFIGWNQIKSELGVASLWGLGGSGKANKDAPSSMRLVEIERIATDKDSATIVARIEWRAPTKDAAGSNLLITETRTLRVSRPAGEVAAQVDTGFRLKAARDLFLGGDVQHAGIHLRVDQAVVARADDTSYLWAPASAPTAGKGYSKTAKGQAGAVVGKDLKWGEFLFPLHGRWYSALQMNAPQNPVEEFSTREYGRFGFFFKRDLKKDESLELKYRFLVRETAAPVAAPKRSAEQIAQARQEADAAYARFLREAR
jgi:hypothetical protein